MIRLTGIALLICLLLGCDNGRSLKKLDPYIYLHDGSSKIWLVDKLLSDKGDHTPLQFRNRQIIAFHESRYAYIYRLHDFGDKQGVRVIYSLDKNKNEFSFQFTKKEWLFDIEVMSRKRIILKPKNDSYPYKMVLIPFPEY